MNKYNEENDQVDINYEIQKYVSHWRLFVVGGLISIIGAFIFIRYTTPTYKVDATIMIEDNKQAGISTELAAFEDLGIIGGGSSNNPENEVEIIKSRKIIGSAIDSLNLDVSYFIEGRIRKVELYDKQTLLFLIGLTRALRLC